MQQYGLLFPCLQGIGREHECMMCFRMRYDAEWNLESET